MEKIKGKICIFSPVFIPWPNWCWLLGEKQSFSQRGPELHAGFAAQWDVQLRCFAVVNLRGRTEEVAQMPPHEMLSSFGCQLDTISPDLCQVAQ